MGLPSKRRTTRSKKERASHFALKVKAITACAQCGAAAMPHRACASCGYYKGKQVVKQIEKRAERRLKKMKKLS